MTLCFYANERRIGDWEQGTILFTAYDPLERFLKIAAPRRVPGQEIMSDADILAEAYTAMSGEGLSYEEWDSLLHIYEPCILCPTAAVPFDGELVLLLELNGTQSRLVWRDYETKLPMHLDLEAGECERVLKAFVNWVAESAAGSN